ncbi:VOC family protein [Roseovarius pacificus]|uniref:VOC family protein n=1 Tax=Roseovarius pacificus TaxID=337701 RepID=UPI003749DB5E
MAKRKPPPPWGGTPVTIHRYVDDCDAVYNRAIEAGATAKMPPEDMFWGDRYGVLIDPVRALLVHRGPTSATRRRKRCKRPCRPCVHSHKWGRNSTRGRPSSSRARRFPPAPRPGRHST